MTQSKPSSNSQKKPNVDTSSSTSQQSINVACGAALSAMGTGNSTSNNGNVIKPSSGKKKRQARKHPQNYTKTTTSSSAGSGSQSNAKPSAGKNTGESSGSVHISGCSSSGSVSFPPFHLPPELAAHYLNLSQQHQQQQKQNNGSSGSPTSASRGKTVFGPMPPPPNSSNTSNTKGSSSTSTTHSVAAAFGNIDLHGLAQSGMLSAIDFPPNVAGMENHTTQQQKDARAAILNAAVAAADSACNASSSNNQSASSANISIHAEGGVSGSINANGSGGTSQPCSEAEMKALMSMFVEIMGLSFDPAAGGTANGTGGSPENGYHADNSKNLKENIMRMNVATSNAAGNSTANNSGNNSNNPFPVFSMMFGGSNGNGNGGNGSGQGMANMAGAIPPPPGGWPPGAAAAAAAAVAAAAAAGIPGGAPIPGGIPYPHSRSGIPSSSGSEWLPGYYEESEHGIPRENDSPIGNKEEKQTRNVRNEKESGNNENEPSAPESFVDSENDHDCSKVKSDPQDPDPDSNSLGKKGAHKYLQKKDQSNAAAAELLREEEASKDDEEEKVRRAAKKREKKSRKKEKAKREAAIKSAQTAHKRREKTINSWRSRVITACNTAELGKLDSLLSENPFKSNYRLDPSIVEELGETYIPPEQEQNENMERLLPYCFIKDRNINLSLSEPNQSSTNNINEATSMSMGMETRSKLSIFVFQMCYHVVFQYDRNGRNALHCASFRGDVRFVQSVVDQNEIEKKKDINKNIASNCLNMRCEDMGWTPLHFAVAGGWFDIVEVLLAGGCDVYARSEPSLTCHINSGEGVTPCELASIIRAGACSSNLVCHGDALREVIDNNFNCGKEELDIFLDVQDLLVKRLSDIEQRGYSTPEQPEPLTETEETLSIKSKESIRKLISSEDMVKKKKKKKKKGPNVETKVKSDTPHVICAPTNVQEEEDPLISALLGMGFSSEQVNTAVDACGGTSRATADDLVMWILENEGNGSGDTVPNRDRKHSQSTEVHVKDESSSIVSTADVSREKSSEEILLHHQWAATQVQKEAAEAAKREEDAKSAAVRLAAKREEQRRINREWNNREQQRQKEEAQLKLSDEVERRRRADIERSKAEAQRVAKEHTFPQHIPIPHVLSNPTTARQAPLSSPKADCIECPPSFPTTSFPSGNEKIVETGKQYQTTAPGINEIPQTFDQHIDSRIPSYHGQVNMSVPSTHNLPPYITNEIQSYTDAECATKPQGTFISQGYVTGSRNLAATEKPNCGGKFASKNTAMMASLEVNGFDFPELGKAQENISRSGRSKNSNQTTDGSLSPRTSKGKQKNIEQKTPSKSKLKGTQNILTPCFNTAASLPSQLAPDPESYDSNPLGEIRATAREFVPTHFTPAPLNVHSNESIAVHAASLSAQSAPPGLVVDSPITESGKNQATSLLVPPSILESNNAFDRSISAISAVSSKSNFDMLTKTSLTHQGHSPVPSTESSITGFSASITDDHHMKPQIGSVMSFENNQNREGTHIPSFLESNPLVGTLGAPLGVTEGTGTSSSIPIGGSSIWGGSSGFSTFNFGDGTVNTNTNIQSNNLVTSEVGEQKKENSAATWGSGGLLNGTGSIW